jgi:MFS transporter, MHS family, proline/betaine transporter
MAHSGNGYGEARSKRKTGMSVMSSDLASLEAEPMRGHATPPAASARQIIVASFIGNVLEWYDFTVYGYFAVALGASFFPTDDPVASTLAAFGVFAVGFLARPLGGVLFGYVGDRFGRKRALTASVALMAVPTVLIGLLPTHAQIGALAGVALVVLRLMQGLAAGGEFTTSVVYVGEHADAAHRGRYGSWMIAGTTSGTLLGSAVGALMATLMPAETLAAWGWRMPFLLGVAVAAIGFWLRRRLPEPALTGPSPEHHRPPLLVALETEWRTILRVFLLCLPKGVGTYLLFVYTVSYLQTLDHIPPREALDINTISMVGLIGCSLAGGALSDRFGRKPVAVAAMVGLLMLSWPLFDLLDHPRFAVMLPAQLCFAVLIGSYIGPLPAMLVEALPRAARCTALAVGYNLGAGLFGGLAPMIATWLIRRTGDEMVPAIMLMVAAALTLVALWRTPETAGRPLRQS